MQPSLGAVTYALNPRLHPDELRLGVGHAAGRALVADATITHLIDAAGARVGGVTLIRPRQDGVNEFV